MGTRRNTLQTAVSPRQSDRLRPVSINIPQALDRLCYRLSVAARGCHHRARAGPSTRGGQERDGQRGILPRPFSRCAADAGRADARVAAPGRGDPAAAARRRAAERPRLPARRQRCQVPAPGGARRSAASRNLARAAARRARAGARPRPTSAISSWPKRSCCSACARTRPRSIRRAIVHPRAQHRRGHDDRTARDGRRATSRSARTADRRVGGRSTAGPRSATRPRSIRSRRSA